MTAQNRPPFGPLLLLLVACGFAGCDGCQAPLDIADSGRIIVTPGNIDVVQGEEFEVEVYIDLGDDLESTTGLRILRQPFQLPPHTSARRAPIERWVYTFETVSPLKGEIVFHTSDTQLEHLPSSAQVEVRAAPVIWYDEEPELLLGETGSLGATLINGCPIPELGFLIEVFTEGEDAILPWTASEGDVETGGAAGNDCPVGTEAATNVTLGPAVGAGTVEFVASNASSNETEDVHTTVVIYPEAPSAGEWAGRVVTLTLTPDPSSVCMNPSAQEYTGTAGTEGNDVVMDFGQEGARRFVVPERGRLALEGGPRAFRQELDLWFEESADAESRFERDQDQTIQIGAEGTLTERFFFEPAGGDPTCTRTFDMSIVTQAG